MKYLRQLPTHEVRIVRHLFVDGEQHGYIDAPRRPRPHDGRVSWGHDTWCGKNVAGDARMAAAPTCPRCLAALEANRKAQAERDAQRRLDRHACFGDPDYVQPTSCYEGRPGLEKLR